MNKSTLAIAALMLTASLAAPEALADRKFRSPQGIEILPGVDGASSVISVEPMYYNPTDRSQNLSMEVVITHNGVPVIGTAYIIIDVAGSISSGCVPHFCDGFCPDPSSFCQPYRPWECGCYVSTARVVSPPLVLHDGDVITATIVAMPGSDPEEYTDNDTLTFVVGPTCAADYNADGARDVTDIFSFLTDWFAGAPVAYNFGGTPGVAAIFAFLTEWFDGCPA